ncbi:hypothetical protein J2X20_002938 [Pelomonas saccharophila]|uniref:DUF1223 domain-containing protein n=1 Tax=Roseateles saccharophilus TaxID=304 RepID=A0ABU1YN48_ROSSA|nr:DUF1223 domain-containing protein [Roseateles saccharophilus]MDR7270280.1 hypothetical protein [Roseateles saccharophilus]
MSTRRTVSEAWAAALLVVALAAVLAALPAVAAPGEACALKASGPPPTVVETYTSEKCSSCPPIEAWLSTLAGDKSVLPLAFHVDYFDDKRWKDRYASAAYTRRQKEMLAASGAPGIYTPQVLVNGRDRTLPPIPAAVDAGVAVEMQAEGRRLSAQVSSQASRTLELAGYWAASENGLSSYVGGGENAGLTLKHDFVVRDYRKLPPFKLAPGMPVRLEYEAELDGVREVALVLTDASSGRPVQALRWKPRC